jgi:hypothetical protein
MSYVERLQPQITLTSPSGLVFEAKWSGDNVTAEKDLGIFKTPGVKGLKIQDLEISAFSYPLTIFFDGPDNDRNADLFVKTLASDKGDWTVIHPVKGEKTLQLVSLSEAVQPISSGNVTVVSTDWLEVTGDISDVTAAQLSGLAVAQNGELQNSAADQVVTVVGQDTADQTGKLKNAVENTVTAFNLTLQTITDTVSEVQAQANSIKRSIDSTLEETPIDVLSIAGQIQSLVNLPNLVELDLNSKIDTYIRFKDKIFEFSPESDGIAQINTAAVQEMALTACLGAVGVASVSSVLISRQNVIDSIDKNLQLFDDITDGLDDIQELYADEPIIFSYFSQSQSYADSSLMNAVTVAYLLKSSFDLAVEKKIILTRQENPVMIAMREYQGPGENDENIDLFYSSNCLTGSETYLLPAGWEGVVYI